MACRQVIGCDAVITPSGDILWSGREAAFVRRGLSLGIRQLDAVNGGAPPELVRLYGEIAEAARRFALKATSDSVSETGRVSLQRKAPHSTATDNHWLTTAEAATLAGWSDQHIRSLCRNRSVVAKRSARGWWLVDRGSLLARLGNPDD